MEGLPPSIIDTFVSYLWTLYIPAFVISLSDGVIIPVLPLYARSMAGSTDAFIAGAVVSGRPLGQMLSDIPCGVVTERLGMTASVLSGCIVMTVGALVATVCNRVWLLLAAQVVVGLGFSLYGVARHGMVGDVDVRIRGRAVAIMGGLARAGWTLGPLAGGYLANGLGMRWPFALTAFLMLISVFMLAFGSLRPSPGQATATGPFLALSAGFSRLWDGPAGRGRDQHSFSRELRPAALHDATVGASLSSAYAGRFQKLRGGGKKPRSSYALLSTSDDEGGGDDGATAHNDDPTTAAYTGHDTSHYSSSGAARSGASIPPGKPGHGSRDGSRGAAPAASSSFGFKLFPRWIRIGRRRPAAPQGPEHPDDDVDDEGDADGYAGVGGGGGNADSRAFVGWDAFPDYGDLDDGDLAAVASVSPPSGGVSAAGHRKGAAKNRPDAAEIRHGDGKGQAVGVSVGILVPPGGTDRGLLRGNGSVSLRGAGTAPSASDDRGSAPLTSHQGRPLLGEEEITEVEEGRVQAGGLLGSTDRDGDGDEEDDLARDEEPPPGLLSMLRTHRREFCYGGMVLALQCLRQSRSFLLPLVATDTLGLSKSRVGLITALTFGVDTLLFYPSGYCMDRYGRKPTGIASMFTLSSGIALLGFARAVPMAVLAAVTIGVGNGLSGGAMLTMGADFAPSGRGRAVFLGVWRFLASTGSMLGPLLAGIVARHWSLAWASWFIAAVGFVATGLWVLFVPESKKAGLK